MPVLGLFQNAPTHDDAKVGHPLQIIQSTIILIKRASHNLKTHNNPTMSGHTSEATMPLNTTEQPDDPLPSPNDFNTNGPPSSTAPSSKPSGQWLTWAIGSGAFAAFNGVFAKLYVAIVVLLHV